MILSYSKMQSKENDIYVLRQERNKHNSNERLQDLYSLNPKFYSENKNWKVNYLW